MKVLITGRDGQVGQALYRLLAPTTHFVTIAPSRQQLDITDQKAVMAYLSTQLPDLIINCAAYTAVDQAETEKALAFAVNCDAVGYLADYCAKAAIPMIHLSTDYLFNGKQQQPYCETASPTPINVYGESKLAGELYLTDRLDQAITLRVSAVFSARRHNFVKTILRLAAQRPSLSVVNDQITCPTLADDIALALKQIINTILHGQATWGCYHYCGHTAISWYDFACHIITTAKKQAMGHHFAAIIPIHSEQFPQQAARPRYAVLDCSKIAKVYGILPSNWENGVADVVTALKAEGEQK